MDWSCRECKFLFPAPLLGGSQLPATPGAWTLMTSTYTHTHTEFKNNKNQYFIFENKKTASLGCNLKETSIWINQALTFTGDLVLIINSHCLIIWGYLKTKKKKQLVFWRSVVIISRRRELSRMCGTPGLFWPSLVSLWGFPHCRFQKPPAILLIFAKNTLQCTLNL